MSEHQEGKKHVSILWGVLGVLVATILLYEAFLYDRVLKSQWANAQYSAHAALNNVRLKLAVGLRLGIPLERYARAPNILREVSAVTGLPLALCNDMGDVLSIAGPFSADLLPQELAVKRDMQVIEGEDGRLAMLPLLAWPDDKVVGCVAVFLHRETLERATRLLCLRNAALHMLVVLLGVGLLSFIAYRRPKFFVRSTRNLAIGILLGVLVVCGCLSLYSSHRQYSENLLNNMDKTGLLLARDFQRLSMAGIHLEHQAQPQAYLASVAADYHNAFSLSLLDAKGREFASSTAGDVGEPFAQRAWALTLDSVEEGPQLVLKAYLHWAPLWGNLRDAGLDMLTLVVIAAVFMLELVLLLERRDRLTTPCETESAHPALLMRPFMFLFVIGYDFSLSLIPLRMGELLSPTAAWREMLMGLSVMAETCGIFLSIVLTGKMLKTTTPLKVSLLGLAGFTLGSLLCMAAHEPWHFIVARFLVGFSYGGLLLAIQIVTVGPGLLPDMYAGFYSGSICGVALGGMLAERLGNAVIFGISSVPGLLLVLVLCQVARGHTPGMKLSPLFQNLHLAFLSARTKEAKATTESIPLRQVLPKLMQSRFPIFLVLAVLPVGMTVGGVLYFYLSVYLHEQGFAQGNIGRIFMLESLVIVCSSVYLGHLLGVGRSNGLYVAFAVALAALGILCLAVLPPLIAAPLAALSIGLCHSFSTPALSAYTLALPAAKSLGMSTCMAVVEFSQRVARFIAPFTVSVSLALTSPPVALCGLGVLFLAMAIVFFGLEWRGVKQPHALLPQKAP